MTRLSHSVSGALRLFSFRLANGSVNHPRLGAVDYRSIFEEPSALEQVYAIFANVIELDADGVVINAAWAEHRVGQYILQFVCGVSVEPPLEDWECGLYL